MAASAASPILRLQWLLAATEVQRKLALLARVTKANFNSNQPRVPAGSPDGGQWTDGGGGGGLRAPRSGAAGSRSINPSRHHYVPQSVYKRRALRPETRKFFDEAKTGPLHGGAHGWDADHRTYNRAVSESFDQFLRGRGIRSEEMTPADARSFVSEIMQSRDPRIRGYNLKLYMREFQYWLRRGPRRME